MLRKAFQSVARSLWTVSTMGLDSGDHIVRYDMYRRMRQQIEGHSLGCRVLSISHSSRLATLLGARPEDITEANYPKHNLCNLALPDSQYSAVVSDQVFEHISCDPQRAVNEVYRVLAPGGIAVHTTCFLTPYHGSTDMHDVANGDYWRYTPSGLALLHAGYSRVIAADGWGNPFMILLNFLGVTRMPVPEAAWHPLNKLARMNSGSHHYVVWVIAQK